MGRYRREYEKFESYVKQHVIDGSDELDLLYSKYLDPEDASQMLASYIFDRINETHFRETQLPWIAFGTDGVICSKSRQTLTHKHILVLKAHGMPRKVIAVKQNRFLDLVSLLTNQYRGHSQW